MAHNVIHQAMSLAPVWLSVLVIVLVVLFGGTYIHQTITSRYNNRKQSLNNQKKQ